MNATPSLSSYPSDRECKIDERAVSPNARLDKRRGAVSHIQPPDIAYKLNSDNDVPSSRHPCTRPPKGVDTPSVSTERPAELYGLRYYSSVKTMDEDMVEGVLTLEELKTAEARLKLRAIVRMAKEVRLLRDYVSDDAYEHAGQLSRIAQKALLQLRPSETSFLSGHESDVFLF